MSEIEQGEIYSVGNHVVACGSSLNKEFIEKVVGDNKIRAVVTDPPYGVAYVENKRGVADVNVDKKIQGDHLQTEYEYSRFTQ